MATILTVDDSASQRKRLLETLTPAGHTVLQAANGEEALALARQSPADLVISDVIMPVMDGLTLVRRLRSLPAYRSVPVLILTTEVDAERRAQARDAGADGWILKPFDPEGLLAALARVLDRS